MKGRPKSRPPSPSNHCAVFWDWSLHSNLWRRLCTHTLCHSSQESSNGWNVGVVTCFCYWSCIPIYGITYTCEWVCVSVCVCNSSVRAFSLQRILFVFVYVCVRVVARGPQIPGSWPYRQLWAVVQLLRRELGSFGRAASAAGHGRLSSTRAFWDSVPETVYSDKLFETMYAGKCCWPWPSLFLRQCIQS